MNPQPEPKKRKNLKDYSNKKKRNKKLPPKPKLSLGEQLTSGFLDSTFQYLAIEGFSEDQAGNLVQTIYALEMKANDLEFNLFLHFPFIVKLEFNDFFFKLDDGNSLFGPESHRIAKYGKCRLTSLKTLKYSIEWGDQRQYKFILSDEIMKVSQNLQEIFVTVSNYQAIKSVGIVEKTLRSVSNFAPTVREITFKSTSWTDLSSNVYEVSRKAQFDKLQLKRLNFIQPLMPTDKQIKLMEFFKDYTPIGETVEEFHWTTPFNDDEGNCPMNKSMHFSGFRNLKILHLNHHARIPVNYPEIFFKILASQSRFLEELTITGFPAELNTTLKSPGNFAILTLKKIQFMDFELKWKSQFCKNFKRFLDFIKMLAPNLESLFLSLNCFQTELRQCHIYAYPFFVTMGLKLSQLNFFAVVINKRLSWTVGCDTGLGISTLDDFHDRLNNEKRFTTKNITKLNFSFIFSLRSFTNREGSLEFLRFLYNTLPNHEVLKEVLEENQEEMQKLLEPSNEELNLNELILANYAQLFLARIYEK